MSTAVKKSPGAKRMISLLLVSAAIFSIAFFRGFSVMLCAENQNVSPSPKIVSFRIIPTTVKAGGWIEFFWDVKDAERVKLYENGRELKGRDQLPNGESGWPLSVPGGFRIRMNKTTNYELVAENREGITARKTLTVEVIAIPPQIVSFRLSPETVKGGELVYFFWEVKNAKKVRLYDDFGELETRNQLPNGELGWPLSTSGEEGISVNKTTTYRLVTENQEGTTTSKTFTVRVETSEELGGTCSISGQIYGKLQWGKWILEEICMTTSGGAKPLCVKVYRQTDHRTDQPRTQRDHRTGQPMVRKEERSRIAREVHDHRTSQPRTQRDHRTGQPMVREEERSHIAREVHDHRTSQPRTQNVYKFLNVPAGKTYTILPGRYRFRSNPPEIIVTCDANKTYQNKNFRILGQPPED